METGFFGGVEKQQLPGGRAVCASRSVGGAAAIPDEKTFLFLGPTDSSVAAVDTGRAATRFATDDRPPFANASNSIPGNLVNRYPPLGVTRIGDF